MPAPYTLTGKVLDTDGSTAVNGASIVVIDVTQGGVVSTTTTDSSGDWTVDLLNLGVDYANLDRVQVIAFTGVSGTNHRSLDKRHKVDTGVGVKDFGNMVLHATQDHYVSIKSKITLKGYVATNTSGTARSIELYDRKYDRLILPIEVPVNSTVSLAEGLSGGIEFDGGICVRLENEGVGDDLDAIEKVPNLNIVLLT